MSIGVMTLVFARSETTYGSRLAMLVIADFADDEGVAYPGIAKIAAKARLSERGAQTAIRAAEEMGELTIETGAGPFGTNRYRINLALLRSRKTLSVPPANTAPPPANPAPPPQEVQGCKVQHEGGADSAPKPSVEPSTTALRAKAAQMADEDYIAAIKKNPAYDGIDIDREVGKARQWLTLPKARGRRLTRSFLVNWLNKCDPTLTLQNGKTGTNPVDNSRRNAGTSNDAPGRAEQYGDVGRVPGQGDIQPRV